MQASVQDSGCSCSGGVRDGGGIVTKTLKMIKNSMTDPVRGVHILDKSEPVIFPLLESERTPRGDLITATLWRNGGGCGGGCIRAAVRWGNLSTVS